MPVPQREIVEAAREDPGRVDPVGRLAAFVEVEDPAVRDGDADPLACVSLREAGRRIVALVAPVERTRLKARAAGVYGFAVREHANVPARADTRQGALRRARIVISG